MAPPAALAEVLAARVEGASARALGERERFTFAVPGGSLAEAFFPRLAQVPFEWYRSDLFWVDERAVGAEDPDSNYALARDLWLRPARVPATAVHRMEGERKDLDGAAREYAAELARATGTPIVLDLALLGVGPDGHVASLFPGHPLLGETARAVASLGDAPKPPPRRLTLTLPVLAAARLLVIAAFGDAKAAVMAAALEDPASELPVARALRAARAALVLLDGEAARALHPHHITIAPS